MISRPPAEPVPPHPGARGERAAPPLHLLWLLVPFVLYLGALPFANRVDPVLLGLPFLFVWLIGATVLTPVAVGLAWRGDRRLRAAREEAAADEGGPARDGRSDPGQGREQA